MSNKGKKKCQECNRLIAPGQVKKHADWHKYQQEQRALNAAERTAELDIPLYAANPDAEQKERQNEAIEHALRQQIERTSAENGALRERVDRQEKIIRHMSNLFIALLQADE